MGNHRSKQWLNTSLDEYLVLKLDEVDHCLIVNCNCCGSKDILSIVQLFEHWKNKIEQINNVGQFMPLGSMKRIDVAEPPFVPRGSSMHKCSSEVKVLLIKNET